MQTSRHNVLADDSAMICVVIPKSAKEEIKSYGTLSGRVRKYIMDGLEKDRRRVANGKDK